MEAIDLKIDNLINLTDIGVVRVVGIMRDRIYYTPTTNKDAVDYLYSLYIYAAGVPLSCELLEFLGFKTNEFNSGSEFYIYTNRGKFSINYCPQSLLFLREGDQFSHVSAPKNLKYIHEIQNLFFEMYKEPFPFDENKINPLSLNEFLNNLSVNK